MVPEWLSLALALENPLDFLSFCSNAERSNIKHAYREDRYLSIINSVLGHISSGASVEEAWGLYLQEFAETSARIEKTMVLASVEQPKKIIPRCCNNIPPTPSMVEMLTTGGYAAAKWVLSGFKIVPMDRQHERLDACESCDRLIVNQWRCAECGCFVKVKAWMATENCPLSKWEEIK